jgi:beta-phosphoglucomutase-like phosphatase (HAD superfamily)
MTKKRRTQEEIILENKAARLNGILGFGLDEASVQLTLEILNSEETKREIERFKQFLKRVQQEGIGLTSTSYRQLRNISARLGYEEGRCELDDVWREFEKANLH